VTLDVGQEPLRVNRCPCPIQGCPHHDWADEISCIHVDICSKFIIKCSVFGEPVKLIERLNRVKSRIHLHRDPSAKMSLPRSP